MKKFLFFIMLLFIFSFNVYAEEDIITKLENGETIEVNVVDPTLLTKTANHYIQNCIDMRSNDGESSLTKEELDEINSYYTPKSIAGETLSAYITSILKNDNLYIYVYDCDEEYNCVVQTTELVGNFPVGEEKIYNAKFVFKGEYNSTIEDEMLKIFTKIEKYYGTNEERELISQSELNGALTFVLEDIRMIDYLYNMSNEELSNSYLRGNAINYTKEIREFSENNFNFFVTQDAADFLPFSEGYGGRLLFGYKDNMYFAGNYEGLINYRYVVYINEETLDTKEAYMDAAKKRINDYYGKNVVEIKYNKSIKDVYIDTYCKSYLDEDDNEGYQSCLDEADTLLIDEYSKLNMLEDSYIFTINGKEYPFLIAKDNNKISYPEGLNTIDYDTNVSIESNDREIPIDSKIDIDVYDENSDEYIEYKKQFNDNDIYDIFDIKLFSINANKYISKLSNNYFRIKIPYKEEYENKKLIAYYVNENGEKEKYNVTKCGEYICFETSHFSIYSIVNDEIDITNIELNEKNISLYVGENKTLIANITPSNATNKTITWESSNESIISVVDGVITANGSGEATISVKSNNNIISTCNVKVFNKINTNVNNAKIDVVSYAMKEDIVNFKISTNDGYKVRNIKIVTSSNEEISYENNTFVMPNDNVTIYIETSKIIFNTPNLNLYKDNNNSLKLTWDTMDAEKYVIYRSTDKKKYKEYKTVTTNTFTDTGLTYGTTYYYKVKAYNSYNGYTEYSNVVYKKVVPNKVTNLKTTSITKNTIKLSFDKVSTTGYEVYRSTNNKSWSKVSTITKNSTLTYTNKKLKTNTNYYYKVRAYKTVKGKKIYGSYSNVLKVRTAPDKGKLSVSLKDYNALNIKVTSIKGASKYQLYRSTDNKNFTLIGEVNSGTYTDANVVLGTTYYYKVKACNSSNTCGSFSSVSKLKVTPKTPSIKLSTTSKKVTVTTTAITADGYVVYRATSKKGKYSNVGEINKDTLSLVDSTKKNKTYYYKIRSYIIKDGKKVYSSYSSIKSIKSK